MNRFRIILPCLFLTLLISPPSGGCQEVGFAYTASNSDHVEFTTSNGLAAHVLVTVNPAWDFRISYYRISQESVKDGRVCQHYVPHVGCRTEETHTSLSLSGLRMGPLRTLFERKGLKIGTGGGLSFNSLAGDAKGVSGMRADLLVPKEGQLGAFGTFSLAVVPYRAIPVTLEGVASVHWVKFNACSAGVPPQYDPFCGPSTFQEFDIGLSFPLR